MESFSNSSDTPPETVTEDISLSPETPSAPPQSSSSTVEEFSQPPGDETFASSEPAAPEFNDTPAVTPSPTPTPAPTTPSNGKSRFLTTPIIAGLCLLLLLAVAFGSYTAGKHSVKSIMTPKTAEAALKIPVGATIIEQCEPGLGTQYILPKDIPDGPVYNVSQGKVIGVEYMTPLSEMSKHNLMLANLPLSGQKYDHINIMTMEAHAGMPEPHFQVDVMMVPDSVAKKITCGSNSSSTMPDMSGSNSKQPSSSSSTMSDGTSM